MDESKPLINKKNVLLLSMLKTVLLWKPWSFFQGSLINWKRIYFICIFLLPC